MSGTVTSGVDLGLKAMALWRPPLTWRRAEWTPGVSTSHLRSTAARTPVVTSRSRCAGVAPPPPRPRQPRRSACGNTSAAGGRRLEGRKTAEAALGHAAPTAPAAGDAAAAAAAPPAPPAGRARAGRVQSGDRLQPGRKRGVPVHRPVDCSRLWRHVPRCHNASRPAPGRGGR